MSIEALADEAIGRLRRRLSEQGMSALGVLIDPTLGDPAIEIDVPDGHRHPLRIRHPDLGEDAQPYVVWMDDEHLHERLLSRTTLHAVREAIEGLERPRHRRAVCTWFLGQAVPLDKLGIVRNLERRAVLRRSASSPTLFRFYDPRVMDRLDAILRPEQVSTMLGSIAAWCYIDRTGCLQTIKNPSPAGAAEMSTASLVFDEQQWAALLRVDWVGRMLHLARGWGPAGAHVTQEALDAELARAQAAGLSGREDCIMFATCAFTLGRQFDHHPFIADILRQSVETSGAFARGMSALDPGTLGEVAEMSRARQSAHARSMHHA